MEINQFLFDNLKYREWLKINKFLQNLYMWFLSWHRSTGRGQSIQQGVARLHKPSQKKSLPDECNGELVTPSFSQRRDYSWAESRRSKRSEPSVPLFNSSRARVAGKGWLIKEQRNLETKQKKYTVSRPGGTLLCSSIQHQSLFNGKFSSSRWFEKPIRANSETAIHNTIDP